MRVNIYKHSRRHLKPAATVSAIVPNYNYADFIIERLDSILFQTYPVSELIILDDASPDNSVEVIKEKIEKIRKARPNLTIKFLPNKVNSGGCVFSQWQKGLKAATGDYIWIAEADDSSNERFLETAMATFSKNPDQVLFYSDCLRINQNNTITAKTSQDWCDIWRNHRWAKDYTNSGKDEIINYLSANNTILNVSSVVWKNLPELTKIFEAAKTYKIAGDWYIYSKVLRLGDIAYSAQPLNYYRKHDKGSVSTTINRSIEYKEVVKIQNEIRDKYNLDAEHIKWQKIRRRFMGFIENEKNNGKKGRIAWFVPDFPPGGAGGHRTIFQNINRLIDHGYSCDMYVSSPEMPHTLYDRLTSGYGEFRGDIFSGFHLVREDYDAIFATSWDTAEPVKKTPINNKLYFVQDFEPWFFPMGTAYLKAENTYRFGFKCISIGAWLDHKLNSEFGLETRHFCFGADSSIYHPEKGTKKENAVCLIFQPFKPRRCEDIALKAMQIVQKKYPDLKIYLYGSAKRHINHLKVTHLGVITTKECNELYNKCAVGLSMSASNPSRIPFEMMSAGLPVVDLYRENNLYDLPDKGVLLAESSPEAIATAIIKILEDKSLAKSMSEFGRKYMKNYSIEQGFDEFISAFDSALSGKKPKVAAAKRTYSSAGIKPSKEAMELSATIKNDAYCDNIPAVSEVAKRGLSLVKAKGKRALKKAAYGVYRRLR